MRTVHVRPRPLDGQLDQVARVRDPQTGQVLPHQGGPVTWSDYWERRLQDGDIEVISPAPPLQDAAQAASPEPAPALAKHRAPSPTASAASAASKD